MMTFPVSGKSPTRNSTRIQHSRVYSKNVDRVPNNINNIVESMPSVSERLLVTVHGGSDEIEKIHHQRIEEHELAKRIGESLHEIVERPKTIFDRRLKKMKSVIELDQTRYKRDLQNHEIHSNRNRPTDTSLLPTSIFMDSILRLEFGITPANIAEVAFEMDTQDIGLIDTRRFFATLDLAHAVYIKNKNNSKIVAPDSSTTSFRNYNVSPNSGYWPQVPYSDTLHNHTERSLEEIKNRSRKDLEYEKHKTTFNALGLDVDHYISGVSSSSKKYKNRIQTDRNSKRKGISENVHQRLNVSTTDFSPEELRIKNKIKKLEIEHEKMKEKLSFTKKKLDIQQERMKEKISFTKKKIHRANNILVSNKPTQKLKKWKTRAGLTSDRNLKDNYNSPKTKFARVKTTSRKSTTTSRIPNTVAFGSSKSERFPLVSNRKTKLVEDAFVDKELIEYETAILERAMIRSGTDPKEIAEVLLESKREEIKKRKTHKSSTRKNISLLNANIKTKGSKWNPSYSEAYSYLSRGMMWDALVWHRDRVTELEQSVASCYASVGAAFAAMYAARTAQSVSAKLSALVAALAANKAMSNAKLLSTGALTAAEVSDNVRTHIRTWATVVLQTIVRGRNSRKRLFRKRAAKQAAKISMDAALFAILVTDIDEMILEASKPRLGAKQLNSKNDFEADERKKAAIKVILSHQMPEVRDCVEWDVSSSSIFGRRKTENDARDYVNNKKLYNRIFLTDWKQSGIQKLLNNEEDDKNSIQREISCLKLFIQKYYPLLLDVFLVRAVEDLKRRGKQMYFVGPSDFADFCEDIHILDKNLSQNDCAICFVQSTVTTQGQFSKAEAKNNFSKLLCRPLFLHSVVRLALRKFWKKSDSSISRMEAVQMLIERHIMPFSRRMSPDKFRIEYLYHPSIDDCFKKYLSSCRKCFIFCGGYFKSSTNRLSTINYQSFRRVLKKCNIEIDQFRTRWAFLASTPYVVNHLISNRHRELSFLDFLEAIARVALANYDDERPLVEKLDVLLTSIANAFT